MHMKRLCSLIGIGVCCISSSVLAYPTPDRSEGDEPPWAPRKEGRDYFHDRGNRQSNDRKEGTLGAGPKPYRDLGVSFDAAFVYDWTFQNGLPLGTQGVDHGLPPASDWSGSGTPFTSGSALFTGRADSPGFEIALGLFSPETPWYVQGRYSFWKAKDEGKFPDHWLCDMEDPGATHSYVQAIDYPNMPALNFRSSRGELVGWRLEQHAIDLVLGRRFFPSSSVVLGYAFGCKVIFHGQGGVGQVLYPDQGKHFPKHFPLPIISDSGAGNPDGAYLFVGDSYTSYRAFSARAAGILQEAEMAFHLSKNFAIYGKFGAAMMLSNYYQSERVDFFRGKTGSGSAQKMVSRRIATQEESRSGERYRFNTILETELGLKGYFFAKDEVRVGLKLACRGQSYSNWTQFPAVSSPTLLHHNLYRCSLIAGASVEF